MTSKIRIVFLCGCLEPGRDGVGDYVRRFAIELSLQGHITAAISLADYCVSDEVLTTQREGNSILPVLRLPSIWQMEKRVKRAKFFVSKFDAQWLSLQFVPFSFHAKGLIFGLDKNLAWLGEGRYWHIMFHELWVLSPFKESIKLWLLGKIQKQLIKRIITTLSQLAIHTQTKFYQDKISKIGFNSLLLPLFSNIPQFTGKKNVINLSNLKYFDVKFVIFGNIHGNSLIREFVMECATHSKSAGTRFCLIFIGRSGSEQQKFARLWTSFGMNFIEFGEQPTEIISEILSNSSHGLSTTPSFLIEKSGSAMAMLEHSLPVLCVAKTDETRVDNMQKLAPGIYQYYEGTLAEWLKNSEISEMTIGLPSIAKQYIHDLYIAGN